MVETCQTREALNAVIDDPNELLHHLQAACELSGLRGESRLQLLILELSNNISKFFATSNNEALVLGHSLLALQYISIGLFTQASLLLDQAKELSSGDSSISRRTLTELHLAQAEHAIGLGNIDEAYVNISSRRFDDSY